MIGNATTDTDLVREALAGSHDAASVLFRRHWECAYHAALSIIGRRAQAEDAAQDAFISALRSLATFDQERPFAPWLKRIAVNKALDLLRAEGRAGPGDDPDHGAIDWTQADSPHEHLMNLVAALDDDRRIVVTLRYWLDFEPLEIAQMLGVPVGTVHSRLGRARAQLREALEVSP